MSRILRVLSYLLLAVAAGTSAAQASFKVPSLSGPVVDEAHLLSPEARASIAQTLRALWNSGGSQIAVLTVDSLDGLPIEAASIQVVDQWKLGTAKRDNGVLLLISKQDRAMRIEVGQGLEGDLPDAYARRIVDDVIAPKLSAGDFDAGVRDGVAAIMRRTDPNATPPANSLGPQSMSSDDGRGSGRSRGLGSLLNLLAFFIVFLIISSFGRRRRRGGFFYWGGGGGGFGGGGGGGGFSGGGGGFSGGGASGKW